MSEAIAAYHQAIGLDPDLFDARNGLGVSLATSGKPEEAAPQFRELIRIDPDSPVGYYNLGNVLADLDRDAESAAAFREVIRINPNHYNAHYNLGEMFRIEQKMRRLGDPVPRVSAAGARDTAESAEHRACQAPGSTVRGSERASRAGTANAALTCRGDITSGPTPPCSPASGAAPPGSRCTSVVRQRV